MGGFGRGGRKRGQMKRSVSKRSSEWEFILFNIYWALCARQTIDTFIRLRLREIRDLKGRPLEHRSYKTSKRGEQV